MKKLTLLSGAFAALLMITSCNDNDDPKPGNDGASSNAKADIYSANLSGMFETGVPLDESNFIVLNLNVTETGPYEITTSEQNGYKFAVSGEFTTLGSVQVKLLGAGIPSTEQLDSVLVVTATDERKVGVQVVSNLTNKIIVTRGGDSFDGVWNTMAFTGRGELLWQIPGGYTNYAAIDNEIVYFSDDEALKAVNLFTGAEIWRNDALKEMENLTFSGGVLYMADGDSDFWAVNANNGQVAWTYDPASIYVPYGAPVVGDNTVYFTAGRTIHAVNKTTGTLVWEGDTFGCEGTPVLQDGTLYMSGGYDGAFAVNATTGEVLWNNDVTTFASPVVKEGRVYLNGMDVVYCFNASTGATLWETEIADLDKSPVVFNDKVFVTTDFGFTSIYALNDDTGEEVWSKNSSMGFAESDLVAHQGMLYLGSSWSVDGFHANSGNLVSWFGGIGTELSMEYGAIMAVYNKDTGETAYPTYGAQ